VIADELAASVRAERVRELYLGNLGQAYEAMGFILVIAVANGIIFAFLAAPWRVAAWFAGVAVTQAATAALLRRYHRSAPSDPALAGWGRSRVLLEGAHGLAWALVVPLVHTPGETVSLVVIMVLLVALPSGMAASLAIYMPSAAAFIIGTLAPAGLFLLAGDPGLPELVAAGLCAMNAVLSTANAFRMSAVYETSIRARLALAARRAEHQALQEAAEAGRTLAETAAAERTRFFGAASHDLRQPVHALGMYASVLKRDPPKAERRAIIASIAACVDSLDRLFTAILGVARAGDPSQREREIPFALDPLIERVLVQFHPEAERRGLRLRRRRTALWVRAEPSAVERIVSNFVANAVRHTEAGGVLVGARRRGTFAEIIVADTGPGLTPEDQARIFDPFVQLDRAGGVPGGFGLGLATVRELGLAHGYELAVASRPGRGSTFSVRLPHHGPVTQDAVRTPRYGAAPPSVLLVEDDPLVGDAVARLLKAWGVTTEVARTGDDALRVLATAPDRDWDVLLDFRLGAGETGLEVADRIRAAHGPRITLTLVTGEADPSIFAAADARGMVTMQKPIRPIQLRALLAARTSEARPAEPARS